MRGGERTAASPAGHPPALDAGTIDAHGAVVVVGGGPGSGSYQVARVEQRVHVCAMEPERFRCFGYGQSELVNVGTAHARASSALAAARAPTTGHLVGVLSASASQGVSIKELRAAIDLPRERLEAAYE